MLSMCPCFRLFVLLFRLGASVLLLLQYEYGKDVKPVLANVLTPYTFHDTSNQQDTG